MIRRILFLVALAWIALLSSRSVAVEGIPPSPTRWVTDNVGFLSPEVRRSLDSRLEAYQRSTGHQVIVWIGDTTGSFPLDEWSTRTFEAWRLGRNGLDDGLALFILAEDRKVAIEVGYGLEDRVPDALAARVINEILVPKLRSGQQRDRDAAVREAVDSLLGMIEGRPFDPGAKTPPPADKSPGGGHPLSLPTLIAIGIGAVLLLILFIVNPALALSILFSILSGRGRRNGNGDGGGGFSGGGGRSGGGGARGSW